MMAVESAEAFASLASNPENQILRGKPNHAMIHPPIFFLAEGARFFFLGQGTSIQHHQEDAHGRGSVEERKDFRKTCLKLMKLINYELD